MKEPPRNLAASVHARLLNQARAGGRSFNDLAQLFAMERFLYRLSKSSHSSRFILKGALLLRVWDSASYRATRDIDLLGHVANEVGTLVGVVQDACRQEVEPDGVVFDAETVHGRTIVEEAEYSGVRISFRGALGTTRLAMQIDVGFGDAITPGPDDIEFPTLLDMPSPRLRAYPPETVIAEKFEIMLRRREANSRMKDFHDLWWLATHRSFDGAGLARAIRATCSRRGTPIPAHPDSLTPRFAADPAKIAQWGAFHRRLVPTACPEDFAAVVSTVAGFLQPVADALSRGAAFDHLWTPPGPWRSSSH